MHIMGIDIGTTTISIVILRETDGEMLDRKTIPHESFIKGNRIYEKLQDPERIWKLTEQAVTEFNETYGEPACIGLTGQMHGMLYADCSGNAVSPLYTWQDGCGNEALDNGQTSVELLNRAVKGISSGYGIATHFYLQKKRRIPKAAVSMTTISDYIAMKLCGNHKPVLGADMAASWGGFDLKKGMFCTDELSGAGMDTAYLPEVKTTGGIVGYTESLVPVISSIGDNQASVYGAVSDFPNMALLNIGTGSQISFASKEYIECRGNVELRPLPGYGYLLAGAGLCGGRAYAMLEQFYREIAESSEKMYGNMQKHAEKFLDRYGMQSAWKVRTTFSGTREDPFEKGSIQNISTDNFCCGAFTVGVMAGVLEELKADYEWMCAATGKRASILVGSGNGIRKNPVMRKLAEEIFEMKLVIPAFEEEAACGAALYALLVSGRGNSLEKIRKRL